jgi:hypothetical protein
MPMLFQPFEPFARQYKFLVQTSLLPVYPLRFFFGFIITLKSNLVSIPFPYKVRSHANDAGHPCQCPKCQSYAAYLQSLAVKPSSEGWCHCPRCRTCRLSYTMNCPEHTRVWRTIVDEDRGGRVGKSACGSYDE